MVRASVAVSVATPHAKTGPIPGPEDHYAPTSGPPLSERQGEMLPIPAAKFTMGSSEGEDDEKPVGKIYVRAFHMGKYEVTVAQYAAFLNANGGRTKDDSGNLWVDGYYDDFQLAEEGGQWKPKTGKEQYPVVYVTWFGAMAYAKWAGARLPTEAEWEKAARGTDGRTYPWGNKWDRSKVNTGDEPVAVGTLPGNKSLYGCIDMGGNVLEWVSSKYSPYPYRSGDDREDLSNKEAYRVVRGGSYRIDACIARAATRAHNGPLFRIGDQGFRLARN